MITLSPEIEALIRSRARADGKTPDELLRDIFEAEAKATPNPGRPNVARMKAIADRIASFPLRDTRSAKEILDEGWGL